MGLGIKKGDKVAVIAGKDKGKTGKVLVVNYSTERIVVEGVNIVKKHMKQRGDQAAGGIKEIPAAIAVSNLALFCSKCNKGVRFGVKVLKDKTKIRVCKKCQQTI